MAASPACPRGSGVSVVVQPDRLRHEMNRRGWAAVDLARESRLSQATISAALSGKPVNARSLGLIARALSRVAAIDIVDQLLSTDDIHLD